MKRLLVPVDFSPLSRHAFDLALRLAERLSGEVILLHAVQAPQTVGGDDEAAEAWIQKEQERSGQALEDFLLDGRTQTEVPVSFCMVEDFPEDGVASWAKRKAADLIVMGTAGPHTLEEGNAGSHALGTLDASGKPVLLLPDGGQGPLPNTLVYAVDFVDHDPDVLHMLQSLVHALDARLHVLHIREHAVFEDPQEYKNYQDTFHELLDDERCAFDLLRGVDVEEKLRQYLNRYPEAWLVLRTRHRGSAEARAESLTRAMAWHSRTPILAFPT
jgi:nucleotide-binding universal stress UspA family protein